MKRKLVAATVAMSMLSGIAAAEQPKAAEYRNIMSSGTYYIEYESGFAKQSLAVRGDERMSYTIHKGGGMNPLSFVPVVGVLSLFMNNEDRIPNALYQNGNYYHFLSKKEALMADEDTLRNPNINPEEGWSSIKNDLTFPEVFAIFAPNDPLNAEVNFRVAEFVESGTDAKDSSKVYDKYVLRDKSITGETLGETVYYLYYNEKGELKKIKTMFQSNGREEEIPFGEIKVLKITDKLPEHIIEIPQECKIYAPGTGDMNDLLDQRVLLEERTNDKEAR